MELRYGLAEWFEPGWARKARAELARLPIAGWIEIDARSAAIFTVALADQLPPSHRLRGSRWRAIGRVDGADDILFAARDGRVAAVHLTWQRERDSRWPRCGVFSSLDEARARLTEEG